MVTNQNLYPNIPAAILCIECSRISPLEFVWRSGDDWPPELDAVYKCVQHGYFHMPYKIVQIATEVLSPRVIPFGEDKSDE